MALFLSGATLGSIRHLDTLNKRLGETLERLSTGSRVNRAKDGAGRQYAYHQLESQRRGFDTVARKIQEPLGALRNAAHGLELMIEQLHVLEDIAVAAANSTTTTQQFAVYSSQAQAATLAIDQIASNTKYNDYSLLINGIGYPYMVQWGVNPGESSNIETAFLASYTGPAGLNVTATTLTSYADTVTLRNQVNAAMSEIMDHLGVILGYERNFTDRAEFLELSSIALNSAISAIRDANVADETASLARMQIQQQAASFVLAQTNSQASIVLRLLQ